MSYYYLTASLPALVLGEAVPFSLDEFRTSVAPALSEEDLAELDLVIAGQTDAGRSAFTRGWHNAETQIRNAVARLRAQRLSGENRVQPREYEGYDVSIQRAVTDAFTKANPLEREMALDRCRWSVLEDLARRDAFGLSAILGFVVRLQMALRWVSLDEETGQKRVAEMIEENLKNEGSLAVADKVTA